MKNWNFDYLWGHTKTTAGHRHEDDKDWFLQFSTASSVLGGGRGTFNPRPLIKPSVTSMGVRFSKINNRQNTRAIRLLTWFLIKNRLWSPYTKTSHFELGVWNFLNEGRTMDKRITEEADWHGGISPGSPGWRWLQASWGISQQNERKSGKIRPSRTSETLHKNWQGSIQKFFLYHTVWL